MLVQTKSVASSQTTLLENCETHFPRTTGESNLTVPNRLGPFELGALIGRGAMGQVWAAVDVRSGTQVAVKLGIDALQRTRLQQESQVLAQLRHPGIVRLVEFSQTEELPYLVLELVTGKTLQDVINEKNPIPVVQIVTWLKQIANALQYCHKHGIIHGDIKPSNIILRDNGSLTLVDFGLARQIPCPLEAEQQSVELSGSPAYMAPELFAGHRDALSPQLDLFSLGILLYELLTGRTPFQGTVSNVVQQILTQDPCPPSSLRKDIPSVLDQLTLRLLKRSKQERFQNIEEVLEELAAL